ncbi:MAG: hypothetical protein BGN88_10325 [Clostridiales bacterium 43-6]|nr:MAG: hypothetical protein BGN88_10325 [Clostridiales bacterium 43-6]
MNKNLVKGFLCIAVTTLGFSTMEITGKMISKDINPFQMTLIRFLIGGLFLLPFAVLEIRKRKLRLTPKDVLFFAAAGTIGIIISMSFFQSAVLYTKASVVAVIFSTNPIFTAPLAALFLGERLTKGKILSLAVSVTGVLFIFNPFAVTPDILGMLLALVAAISFSCYTVLSKKRVAKYGSLVLNSFSFLLGDAILLILMLVIQKPVLSGISTANLPHLLYLGIFVTGIGYLCYFSAMKYTSAVTASTVFFIKPAVASVLSVILLGETIGVNTVIGILLIIVSSYLLFRQNQKALQ